MGHHQPTTYSANGLFLSVVAVVTISCLLPNTAAGSCLQYGHSCWGAHGKRSNLPPMAVQADLVQPEVSLAAPADEPPASWEPSEETSQDNAVPPVRDPWQRLRRPLRLRSGPQGGSRATDDDDVDYEVPPPRWIYKIMRQTASK